MIRVILSKCRVNPEHGTDDSEQIQNAVDAIDPKGVVCTHLDGLYRDYIPAALKRLPAHRWILTQNPNVVDAIPVESAEDFRAKFWRWDGATLAQFTAEEREDFWESRQVGFQHASELRRVKGLW